VGAVGVGTQEVDDRIDKAVLDVVAVADGEQ
jgi:hypothetical protein